MAAKKDPETVKPDELAFEDALERLESIVEELEGGDLSLEQSIRHYEEGMKLSKKLTRTLDEAEKSIEKLVEGDDDDSGEEAGPATPPAARKGRRPRTEPMELELGGGEPAKPKDDLPF
jgi:exodeoxyribonuclease VII small subunit